MHYYKTEQNDTWDILALDIYGKEQLAHVLQSANPDLLGTLFFPASVILKVPPTPANQSNQAAPPWERGILLSEQQA